MDNFAKGEIGEAQRQQAEARGQALQSLAGLGVTPDWSGKITVWDKIEKKYVTGHPIDLAERAVHNGGSVNDIFSKDKPESE